MRIGGYADECNREIAGEMQMTDERNSPPTAWKPGQSGNPAGKPPGTRNKATQMVMALMEGHAEQITQTIIDAANRGDLAAARMVLERLAPPVRERPLALDLPDTSTAEGISAAQRAVLEAVGAGEILPAEATALSSVVDARRKAFETEELERRISLLEERHAKE
jgi:hypothetical protein